MNRDVIPSLKPQGYKGIIAFEREGTVVRYVLQGVGEPSCNTRAATDSAFGSWMRCTTCWILPSLENGLQSTPWHVSFTDGCLQRICGKNEQKKNLLLLRYLRPFFHLHRGILRSKQNTNAMCFLHCSLLGSRYIRRRRAVACVQ